MERSLQLHHELLLLALSDDEGTVAFSSMLGLGLGGALLTELLLAGRIEIVDEGGRWNKQFVEVRDKGRLSTSVLDEALGKLRDAKRRSSPSNAVSRLSSLPKLRHRVAQELCRQGVLRETEQQVLLLFRRRVYPTVDGRPEQALIRRVRNVLDAGKSPDDRTAALIGIANLTGALGAIYDRKERRALKARLKVIAESSAGSKAAGQAIAAAHAAIMTATTAAAIAAS